MSIFIYFVRVSELQVICVRPSYLIFLFLFFLKTRSFVNIITFHAIPANLKPTAQSISATREQWSAVVEPELEWLYIEPSVFIVSNRKKGM